MGPRLLPSAAAGLGLGALWGVVARVWMRLISDEPEFTWTGTLLIIAFSALLGLGVGVVHATRRTGRSRWWVLSLLPGLVLFLGPGMLLAPAFLLGGLARGRRGRILQGVGAVAIAGPIYLLWRLAVNEPTSLPLVLSDWLVLLVGFALLSVALASASALLWQPRGSRPTGPERPVRDRAGPVPGRGRARRHGVLL